MLGLLGLQLQLGLLGLEQPLLLGQKTLTNWELRTTCTRWKFYECTRVAACQAARRSLYDLLVVVPA